MSEPFIQTRGRAVTPQPRQAANPSAAPPPPPPPPPPPVPGKQGGVNNGGVNSRGAPPAQLQNMAPQVPPPPAHALPAELRGRPSVQMSDIRQERMTEGDAREILTQFKVVRFEKCHTTNEFDAEGKAVKPTWGKCMIIDENDTEQAEARRRVKELDKERNRDGQIVTITDRKTALPTPLKAQLEKQQLLLQRDDDPRFIHTLVQLENICRPLEDGKKDKKVDVKSDSKDKDKKTKEKKYEWDRWDTKRIATEKKGKSKFKERIAVRAYYKRSPAPNQDALQLYQQQQAHLQQQQLHQRDQEMMILMQQQQLHQARMNPPPPPPPPPANEEPPPDAQPIKPAAVQILQLDEKKNKRNPRSECSSGESYYSDEWSGSEGNFGTPQSSIGSNISGKHKHRRHERRHHKDKAKYYNGAPRTVPVGDGLYVVATGSRGGPGAPTVPRPRLPPVDIDRLRSGRYLNDVEENPRERLTEEPHRRAVEPGDYALRPLERQRSYPRMSPVEARHERFDDFEYEQDLREIARLERIALEEEELERERERERRAEDAAYERLLREHPVRRVVVRPHGRPTHHVEYRHAPYIRTASPSYVLQEERAEDYMDRRSAAAQNPHPFQPRPRRVMIYDD